MKSYNKGRQTVLTAVKKSKYHQILQNVGAPSVVTHGIPR